MSRFALAFVGSSLACGPSAPSSEASGGDTSTSHAATTSVSASSSASTATDGGGTTTTTTTGVASEADVDVDTGVSKFDHPPPDAAPIDCPEERNANSEVNGASPLGAFDLPYGWWATGGGGKCPYGYRLEFSSAIPFDGDTPDRLALFLEYDGPGTYPTGDLPVLADHDHAGEHVFAEGTATITAAMGPDEQSPRLVGTFVVDDPAWALGGSFDVPWCDLLYSGGCGA